MWRPALQLQSAHNPHLRNNGDCDDGGDDEDDHDGDDYTICPYPTPERKWRLLHNVL